MSVPAVKPSRPHLLAFLLALGVVVMLLVVAALKFKSIGNQHMPNLIVMPFKAKDQGEWVQREAFLQDDVLPVVGSSELTLDVVNRASEIFRSKPTGFQVCPIGRAGNTSILMAEKLAALGERMRGRKIALIFSSSWFYRFGVPDDSYAGNFSPLQALRLLRNEQMEAELRKRFHARMLEFPDTLVSRSMLGAYVHTIGSDGLLPALKYRLIQPLIEVQRAKLSLEDLFATAFEAMMMKHSEDVTSPKPQAMEWDKRIAQMEAEEAAADPDRPILTRMMVKGVHDDEFVAEMNASREWDDFKLLLDTLKSFGAKALLISVPITGSGLDRHGVSGLARDQFYHRFESMCAEHGYQAQTFSDHDLDDGFTIPKSSHFTPKGWLYVDRVLDDFYHDRPIGEERK